MTEKLSHKLEQAEIQQTRTRPNPIRFKDEAINKVRKENFVFGRRTNLYIPFQVSKDSHLKGLKLRIFKGAPGESNTLKVFYLQYWFNGKSNFHKIATYTQRFGVKECNDYLIELQKTHIDFKTGYWIKNPNETRRNENRIVEKPDPTAPKGYTVNEIIESYMGAVLPGETTERGFSRDQKDGYRRAKSCGNWFRYMAGYNNRSTLIRFMDDEDGYGYAVFKPNKHLRVAKPVDMTDLFRKYPSGRGMEKDREYYNRRKKQWYTIEKSQNYSIYDSYIGKTLMSELTHGDIEKWLRDKSSWEIKQDYIKCFITLWKFARKRGWLGTEKKLDECPFDNGQVFVKKEIRSEDPYKHVAMESEAELELFWQCSEKLAKQFPFKAELHQFMILTAIRKSEALRMKKEYIDFEKGKLHVPKAMSKTEFAEELPITPELEILLRNILDYKHNPQFKDFYGMRDFPWLFATRKWKADRYFNKEFKMSPDARSYRNCKK